MTKRILFLAHRRELILQTSRKLYDLGIDHGVLLPGHRPRPAEPVQVASIAALHARAIRADNMSLPQADLVIIDEAHHARANIYAKIIEAYPNAVILGLTATPCRGDGRGLGNLFEVMVECPQVQDLIAAGYLVPTKVYAPSDPDLGGVMVRGGDYVNRQLVQRMDNPKLIGDVVSHWIRLGERRSTVVFATGVAHAKHLRDEFCRAGVLAEHLDGTTPVEERDAILANLAAGKIDLVCNAMVLTEGWDAPSVSCLVLARPTKSLGLYRQMVGRVLRPAPGKTDALILDHAGATFQHGFAEDPIEWALNKDQRSVNKVHVSRGTSPTFSLTACPECSAVRFGGEPCPACGWQPRQKAEAFESLDGELGYVGPDRRVRPNIPSEAEKSRVHRQLLWIARERGYKSGWAAHKFKKKFGTWPITKSWASPAPLQPDDALRAWVRSQDIAHANATQGRRGRA